MQGGQRPGSGQYGGYYGAYSQPSLVTAGSQRYSWWHSPVSRAVLTEVIPADYWCEVMEVLLEPAELEIIFQPRMENDQYFSQAVERCVQKRLSWGQVVAAFQKVLGADDVRNLVATLDSGGNVPARTPWGQQVSPHYQVDHSQLSPATYGYGGMVSRGDVPGGAVWPRQVQPTASVTPVYAIDLAQITIYELEKRHPGLLYQLTLGQRAMRQVTCRLTGWFSGVQYVPRHARADFALVLQQIISQHCDTSVTELLECFRMFKCGQAATKVEEEIRSVLGRGPGASVETPLTGVPAFTIFSAMTDEDEPTDLFICTQALQAVLGVNNPQPDPEPKESIHNILKAYVNLSHASYEHLLGALESLGWGSTARAVEKALQGLLKAPKHVTSSDQQPVRPAVPTPQPATLYGYGTVNYSVQVSHRQYQQWVHQQQGGQVDRKGKRPEGKAYVPKESREVPASVPPRSTN